MKVGFSPDRPIESAQKDLLGRSPFASLIAEMISRWRQRECLVIALYGAWGSGKSSVKNLILERLAQEKYKLAPIEFNPWLALGVEKITETFFTEIGVKLFGKTDESDKHRAAKWKRYADYLEIGSYVATVTAPALVEKGIRFLKGKAARRAESFEKKENGPSISVDSMVVPAISTSA